MIELLLDNLSALLPTLDTHAIDTVTFNGNFGSYYQDNKLDHLLLWLFKPDETNNCQYNF